MVSGYQPALSLDTRAVALTGMAGMHRAIAAARPQLATHQLQMNSAPISRWGPLAHHFVQRRRPCRAVAAASSDDLGLVRKEENRDGSITFVFGDAPQKSQAATAASRAAEDLPPQAKAAAAETAQAAAAVPAAAVPTAAVSDPADPAPAADSSKPVAASAVASDAEPTSETEAADAEANCFALSKDELGDMKVAELHELCKEHGLKGYSQKRKHELVKYIAQNLCD